MHHLGLFNQAMLAKIGWYIIHHPHNLGPALLKVKYFHVTCFLDTLKGKRPLYLWSSILWERQLLWANLGWMLGDGHRISV